MAEKLDPKETISILELTKKLEVHATIVPKLRWMPSNSIEPLRR